MNDCKCPYCGKNVSYFTALAIRRRGEYYCKKCKKESNVHINKTIWVLYLGILVLALLILGYYMFLTNRENPWFILFVALPFFLFYFLSPLFVRLRSKKKVQDSLYDTDMMNAPIIEPDPTMATSAAAAPAFMDDIDKIIHQDDVSPINSDVFNAIKEERRAVAESDGSTKAFDKFDSGSFADGDFGDTKPVGNLKNISSTYDYPDL